MSEILWILLVTSPAYLPWVLSLIGTSIYQPSKKNKLLERENNSVSTGDCLSTLSKPLSGKEVKSSQLMMANVVMSPSWIQLLIGWIISIFGGEVAVFTGVVDWARREAQQQLRETVKQNGYDDLINMRIETTVLTKVRGGKDKTSGVEILAYGTAIRY